jgi:hypothetical protein
MARIVFHFAEDEDPCIDVAGNPKCRVDLCFPDGATAGVYRGAVLERKEIRDDGRERTVSYMFYKPGPSDGG